MKTLTTISIVLLNIFVSFSQTITEFSNEKYIDIEKVNKNLTAYSNKSYTNIVADKTKPTITIYTNTKIKYENSAIIKGKVYDASGVKSIKINGYKISFDKSGNFEYNVGLTNIKNIFTIVATDNNDNTKSEKITLTKFGETKKPILTITNNFDNEQLSPFVLRGEAKDDNQILKVIYILNNGDKIEISDKNGAFSKKIELPKKENTLTIKATDMYRNETVLNYTVKRKNLITRNEKDYAIFFAVNDYNQLQGGKLSKPINDAKEIADILEDKYGYKCVIKNNPTRKTIREVLKNQTKNFDNNGQLLIFFSGHGGVYDNDNGYFTPKDLDTDDVSATCYSYSDLRTYIKRLKVKHVLVYIDACYSAYIDPKGLQKGVTPPFGIKIKKSNEQIIVDDSKLFRTRKYISSDSEGSTTPDKSKLTQKLIEGLNALHKEKNVFTLQDLATKYLLKAKVKPRIGNLDDNEENATYIFVTKQ